MDVTERIKLIRPLSPSVFPYSNSVYIEDDLATLVDAGSGSRAYNDIHTEQIELLLLSHIHYDHIHNAGLFKNARTVVAREEAYAYSNQDAYLEIVGLNLWERFMEEKYEDKLVGSVRVNDDVGKIDFNTFKISEHIWDGKIFDTGHIKITAIHTPGHSPGHYAFYFEPDDVLFSSDLDLAPLGPWYGGGLGDVEELENSLRKLIAIKPAKLITSHRRIFDKNKDDIPALLKGYLDVVLTREERIKKSLREPRQLEQIFDLEWDFEGHPETHLQRFWSKVMFYKHLRNLQKKGVVMESEDGCWVQKQAW